jgi:hypothetical protein
MESCAQVEKPETYPQRRLSGRDGRVPSLPLLYFASEAKQPAHWPLAIVVFLLAAVVSALESEARFVQQSKNASGPARSDIFCDMYEYIEEVLHDTRRAKLPRKAHLWPATLPGYTRRTWSQTSDPGSRLWHKGPVIEGSLWRVPCTDRWSQDCSAGIGGISIQQIRPMMQQPL